MEGREGEEVTLPAGLHIVTKRKAGRPVTHYVYAWRGGPQIARIEGGPKPAVTAHLSDLAAAARGRAGKTSGADTGSLSGLIASYRASPEWDRLSASTKTSWRTWQTRIEEEFGKLTLSLLKDRRVRAEILAWRDRWASQPRSADLAMQVFSRLLGWAVGRGLLDTNILTGVESLYEADRSDLIWEPAHFATVAPHAAVEIQEGIDLAAGTGLRRGDLVKLPWTAVGEHAIVWRTGKSRGRNLVTIPLLPETKALLARIKKRHASEMAGRRPARRKPLPATVLSSSHWAPWTPSGFGSRFNDAKKASGLDRNFHDLRGTFVTRCCIAGLSDQEIANIVGWSVKDVAAIRVKYADQARVVVAIGERIAAAGVNRL